MIYDLPDCCSAEARQHIRQMMMSVFSCIVLIAATQESADPVV